MDPAPAQPPPPAPRTPTRRQLFYARNGPFRILHVLVQAACIATFLWLSGLLADGVVWNRDALWRLLWVFFLAVVLAMCVTIVVSTFFLTPFYRRQEQANGAPFAVGDSVQVLTGPHAGRVGKIYATWQGETLRVDLGEEPKARYRDIFAPAQLLRADGDSAPR